MAKTTQQSKNYIKISSQVEGGKDFEIEKLLGGNYTSTAFMVSMAKRDCKLVDMYLTLSELTEIRDWINQRLEAVNQ